MEVKMATEDKPVKGILKHTSSLDKHDNPAAYAHEARRAGMKWDEMNILATHHPPDKEYGHMKIDEPPTPYSKYSDPEDEDGESERRGSVGKLDTLDPTDLAAKLTESQDAEMLKEEDEVEENSDGDEEDTDDTEQDDDDRHLFELKRKLHYNEFQAVQLAKKLMAEEAEEEEEEEAVKSPVEMDNDSDGCKQNASSGQ